MKFYLSIAVLITFMSASLCFATVNYPLLAGGAVVSTLVFMALRHFEIEKKDRTEQMSRQLDAALTNAVTDLSAKLEHDMNKVLAAHDSLMNELIAAQHKKTELDMRLHDQRLEQQQKTNNEITGAIGQHALTLHQLVDRLMEITSEMSESKDVAREQILRMQETYVNELRQRVRA